MIDLIVLTFFSGVFYAGFYFGRKYASVRLMLKAWAEYVSGIFKS